MTHERLTDRPTVNIYHGIAAYANPWTEMETRDWIMAIKNSKGLDSETIKKLVQLTSRETVRAVLGREP